VSAAGGTAAQRAERAQLWSLAPMLAVQVPLFVVPLAIMFVYSF
jgi:hypothetical protein